MNRDEFVKVGATVALLLILAGLANVGVLGAIVDRLKATAVSTISR